MFVHVLEKSADEQVRRKWNSLRNNLGLPEASNEEVMGKVLDFAQVELPEMILQQRGLQCGLPMTENQKKRESELKLSTKTRAAQALVSTSQATQV